jgi:signal transduction histidine kinase
MKSLEEAVPSARAPRPSKPGVLRLLQQAFIVFVTIAILASIWFAAATTIRAHHAETNTEVESSLTKKALVVEEQLRRQLLMSDQTLRILEVAWEREPEAFRLETWRGRLVALDETALQIFVADAQGIVRQSTRPEIIGSDVSQRDYFRYEAELPKDNGSMFINPPVLGLVTQRWQLNLVRRLDYPDGRFGGVVSIATPTNPTDQVYTAFDLGEDGLIALVSLPDGSLLAQGGPGQTDSFKRIRDTPLLRAVTSQKEGVWIGPTPTDGRQRFHAFATVPERPLAVVVAVGTTVAMEAFTAWRQEALLLAGLLTLLVLTAATVLLQGTRAAALRENALALDRERLTEANSALEQARADAQAKAARLQAAMSSMTDGIMMVDPKLRLLEWNDNFAEFTGVPPEILRPGLPMRDMLLAQARAGEFGPGDPETEVERRMAILENSASLGTIERVRPNGRVLEIRRSLIPGGGYVSLYTDSTERHLAAERVRQAQTMAAIGRLTAGVAHDFNNLLASITLNAEMLEIDLEADPRLERRASVILQASNRGAALVAQLLAFSRKQELLPSLLDINAVITGMLGIIRTSIGSTITLELNLDPDLWPALVDPVQIEHVILNLVINARDAMPEGGILTITTANQTLTAPQTPDQLAKGDYVAVAVTDTGCGMTEDVRRNAFDPFFTTKGAGKGSGLGLSQVYGVTKQSGGGAEIISAPQQGTTVRLLLPRAGESGLG